MSHGRRVAIGSGGGRVVPRPRAGGCPTRPAVPPQGGRHRAQSGRFVAERFPHSRRLPRLPGSVRGARMHPRRDSRRASPRRPASDRIPPIPEKDDMNCQPLRSGSDGSLMSGWQNLARNLGRKNLPDPFPVPSNTPDRTETESTDCENRRRFRDRGDGHAIVIEIRGLVR